MNEHIKRFNARLAELKEERRTYETVWQDILDHCAPDLSGYISTGQKKDGERNDYELYDKDPERNCLACASGLFTGISSPARPWAKLTMRNDQLDAVSSVRQWLDDEMAGEYEVMSLSNFYQAMFATFLHQTALGVSCMLMLPDYEDVIRCEQLNAGSYWLGANGRGKIDSLYREFWLSVRNIVNTFPDASQNLKDMIKDGKNQEKPYKIIHVIEPNDHKLAPFKDHKWVSAYYLDSGNESRFLEVGGYEVFPVLAPRWYANQGETYGKMNPGRVALGDMKQLQVMINDFNEALQKINNPPLQAPADVNETGQVYTMPSAINIVSGMTSDATIKPLFAMNPEIAAQWQAINDKKDQVRKAFYIDLFMAISMRSEKDMTAEEVRALAGERMLMLGPAYGNFDRELLTPALELLFYYRQRAGLVQEPPEEIQGETFRPEYISTLAQAQRMQDTNRIGQLILSVKDLAGLNPEALDKLDVDATIDHIDSMLGAPSGMIRSNDDAGQIRQARFQQQQAQAQAAAMMTAAEGAKTLGQTPVGGQQPNALDAVLQGMGVA